MSASGKIIGALLLVGVLLASMLVAWKMMIIYAVGVITGVAIRSLLKS